MEVQAQGEAIRRLGAEVVVVSFEPAGRLPFYREHYGWAFRVVSDPERVAYRAFGLEPGGWLRLFRPGVFRIYAKLLLKGRRPLRPEADVLQLGGDFVLDERRRLVFAHRSQDPADRPAAGTLIKVLEGLSPSSSPSRPARPSPSPFPSP